MGDEETGPEPASQADLLGEMRVLRRRARAARHAYWFPLVLFGLLTCASVPFYVQSVGPGGRVTISAGPGPRLPVLGGGSPGLPVQHYLGYYWLAALLGGLLLTLLWYRRNARRVGLQTPARGYVIIAAGLWALAWAERSRALAVIAVVYTGAALLASLYNIENLLFRLGRNPAPSDWDLTSLPNVPLPAFVLLVTGAGAFAVQQRHRAAA
jgi:hypothetical protein